MVSNESRLCVCYTALYARISVQCNQCKLKYQKSSAVSRCLLTVFNEVFLFSLPEVHLERCKIVVSVYETHTSRKSAKQLIGQLSVAMDRSSENEHWTLMMRSVRQPVAKWHGLLIWLASLWSRSRVSNCSGLTRPGWWNSLFITLTWMVEWLLTTAHVWFTYSLTSVSVFSFNPLISAWI